MADGILCKLELAVMNPHLKTLQDHKLTMKIYLYPMTKSLSEYCTIQNLISIIWVIITKVHRRQLGNITEIYYGYSWSKCAGKDFDQC